MSRLRCHTAKSRVRTFLLLLITLSFGLQASSVSLSSGGLALDSLLKTRPLPDTIKFEGTTQQTYELKSDFSPNTGTIHFLGVESDPDKFPIVNHTANSNYGFFQNTNLFFERITFETSMSFDAHDESVHTRSFKNCVFRNGTGGSFFKFSGMVASNIIFENSLFHNNNCAVELNFWSAAVPNIKITNCTFDGNDTVFKLSNTGIVTSSVNITNCIFSDNALLTSGDNSTINLAGRITQSFSGDPEYISDTRTNPSDWKLTSTSPARAYCDTTGLPKIDIASNLRGSENGKFDAGCWAILLGGAPEITTQPEDSIVAEGAAASFSLSADGSEPLTYQWYKNAELMANETLSVLSIPSVTVVSPEDTIVEFYCKVINNLDSVTSDLCTLFVIRKPDFTVHPEDAGFIEGSNVSFTAAALRADGYYWLEGDDSLPGSESNILSLTSVTESMNGTVYRCVAYNIAGKDTSTPAVLTVFGNAPQILVQPEIVTVLKDSSAIFFLVAQGAELVYNWYQFGNATPVGTGNDSLIIPNATENDSFFCVVSNQFGVISSDTVDLIVIESTVKNPIFIKQVSLVDRRHVRISFTRFNVLPTVVSDQQPYVDSIGIWYEDGKFPISPIKNVPNFLKVSMAEILASGETTFEKIFEVNRRECITYYFVASPFWNNPETLPAFDTLNGAKLFMCSTDILANPLSLNTDYNLQNGTIDLSIEGINAIEKDSLEYMLVWYAAGDNIIKSDTIKPAALADLSTTWTKMYTDALFNGPETTITFSAKLRGILGNYSETNQTSLTVGTPRTVNYVTLSVDSVRSNEIKLKWDILYGENVDKVKIWYGTKQMQIGTDFDTSDYINLIFDAQLKEALIGNLLENTVYYFGLQTYVSGQYWSFITENSSKYAKTMNPDDIFNAITITDLKFDSSSNKVILKWNLDTTGMSDLNLKTGICWDLQDQLGHPDSIKEIDSTLKTSYVDSIDLDRGFLFDTTYYFTLWMGYKGKDGGLEWADPTDVSKRSVRIKHPGWYSITYFKQDDSIATAFNQKVILRPGPNWDESIWDDSLIVFKPSSTQLKPGLNPVSIGVDFKRDYPSELLVSLKCDSLLSGCSVEDVYMYQYDELTKAWTVMPRESFDNLTMTVTSAFNPYLKKSPIILMIDTQEPVVTILSDTGSIVVAKTFIIDSIKITDNIVNSKAKIFLIRNGDTLSQAYIDSVNWYDDTIKTVIDANIVSQNNSVFAFLVVSDGRNSKWINISRRVSVDFNNAKLTKEAWSPVYSHSMLDNPAADEALIKISSEAQWNYDIIQFRIYTWAKQNSNTNSWVEYSEQGKDLFKLLPGRILWVKTRESKAINLGQGYTLPLKETYSDIVLSAKNFTDVALPLHFNVVVQDILDSTMYNQDSPQSLGFYYWTKNDNGRYMTKAHFIPNTVNFNNPKVVLEHDSCYSIYNSSENDITLRIPLITDKMSKNRESSGVGPLSKSGSAEQWNIAINPRTEDGSLSPVYCGFSPGKGDNCFPVSPSFSKVRVGVLDSDGKRLYGIMVKNEKKGNGISYPLVFDNEYSETKSVSYGLENWGSLPSNYKVSVFDPDGGTFETTNNNITLGAGEKEYRYLIVGDETYHSAWKNNFPQYSFSLLKAYPNPFRSRIQIQFTMPYSGINRMRLAIYDQLGRRLWLKELGKELHPGENMITWNPSEKGPLASGAYILQLTAFDGSGKVKGVKRERVMFMP